MQVVGEMLVHLGGVCVLRSALMHACISPQWVDCWLTAGALGKGQKVRYNVDVRRNACKAHVDCVLTVG